MALLGVDEMLARIRFDPVTKRGSALDVIQLVSGCTQGNAPRMFQRILEQNPSLFLEIVALKFPGRGQRPTPTAALPVLVKIIMEAPGRTAKKWRVNAAQIMCRALGGDESLCQEIQEQACITEGTRTALLAEGVSTPLQEMDFSYESHNDDPSGIVYLAGSKHVEVVKVGSWAGEENALLSRYRTYYGPEAWVQCWRSQRRRRDEHGVLFALKQHSLGGELISVAALQTAVDVLTANLGEFKIL